MDPLKSDRNKRQACVLTLPHIHLRLYPFDLNSARLSKERIIFLITFGCLYCKMLCKMLLTNLVEKKKHARESCLYAPFFCVLQGFVNCLTRGGIFTMPFHNTFYCLFLSSVYFGVF